MTMNQTIQGKSQVADLMLELEKVMREGNLWSEHPPAMDALMSQMPFACDQLSLQEWLQWMFIPKMKSLIESDAPLPSNSNIFDYAEEVFKTPDEHTQKEVMALIKKLDEAMQ